MVALAKCIGWKSMYEGESPCWCSPPALRAWAMRKNLYVFLRVGLTGATITTGLEHSVIGAKSPHVRRDSLDFLCNLVYEHGRCIYHPSHQSSLRAGVRTKARPGLR